MREIKFKIYADNKFYDKCLVGNTNNHNDDKWTCPMVWLEDKKEWVHCDNGIILQYVGLKDKNGVEIYENMIINNKYIVIYNFCKFALKNIKNGNITDFKKDGVYEITREYFEQ